MILNLATVIVTLSVLLVAYRVLRGPSWGDRIMAFDFLSVNLVVLFALLAVRWWSANLPCRDAFPDQPPTQQPLPPAAPTPGPPH